MKSVIARTWSFGMRADTPRERELFSVMTVSEQGVDVYLADESTSAPGVVLHLPDAIACALLANLAQVAHRRLREIEIARIQTGAEDSHASGSAAAPAVGAPSEGGSAA